MSHTSMHYEEICTRTIPQIEAILGRMGKHISLKLGVPWNTGTAVATTTVTTNQIGNEQGKAPKLSELASFCGVFNGVEG